MRHIEGPNQYNRILTKIKKLTMLQETCLTSFYHLTFFLLNADIYIKTGFNYKSIQNVTIILTQPF